MVDNLYLHWLLIFALGRLGHVSASLDPAKHEQMLGVLVPDAIFSEKPITTPKHAAQTIVVTPDWLNETIASQAASLPLPSPKSSDPARIVTSSGTTGRPKKILFTHGDLMRRMQGASLQMYSRRMFDRFLSMLGIDTFGGYSGALRAWFLGGTVCLFGAKPERLVGRQVSGLLASPVQLRALIGRIPPDFGLLPGLSVLAGGTKTPRDLALILRLRLTPDVTVGYGSTEAGAVAAAPARMLDADPDLTGIAVSGAEIGIVDEAGHPLPPGETGEIRLRTQEMARGYLEDEEATARHFRDGWFFPGDLGSLSADGELRVIGRTNDVLNAGGVKIAPDALEEALITAAGIADVGVFSTQADSGAVQLWAAIVENGPVDRAALQEVARKRMASGNAALRFVSVTSIPRNAMGKIERFKLREAVQETSGRLALSA